MSPHYTANQDTDAGSEAALNRQVRDGAAVAPEPLPASAFLFDLLGGTP